ncbi:YjbH domain-containing protein [Limnobacter parvus]|uniref:YjbH domain-containing protein n=1 Tax=Limnobacter parvus TaxID=2939690 RepID=A0ABT1XD53_9BURK|nr:YjbH domain-containing protein [Limnobacter parvus]MCR2745205.1 YjbH domain-containing protein [Limnobacter parvus]
MKIDTVLNRRSIVLLATCMLAPVAANAGGGGHGIDFSWAGFWRGGDLPASTSYAGATGLLNSPSAEILDQGVFALHRDNFIDRRFGARSESGNSTALVVGILPFLEVSGRLANYDNSLPPRPNGFDQSGPRDLSANLKIQVPRLFDGMPFLAIGATDVGGAANNFESTYAVATQPWGPFKFTAGVGAGPDQFDGAFGGVEMDVFNTGVSLLLENDARDTFAGVRYTSPEIRRALNSRIVTTVSRSFGALNERNIEQDRTEFSVALQIPLQPRESAGRLDGLVNVAPSKLPPRAPLPQAGIEGERLNVQRTRASDIPDLNAARKQELTKLREAVYAADPGLRPYTEQAAQELQSVLVQHGLEEVRVGLAGNRTKILVIQYQNQRFVNNELDAVGLVLGEAVRNTQGLDVSDLLVISLKAKSPIFEVFVRRDRYAAFLAGEHAAVLNSSFEVRPGGASLERDIDWLTGKKGRSYVRVMLEPRLTTRYGTEVATVDYSAGLATNVYAPLWRGAELSTSYVDQLYKSTNFRQGGVFSGEEIRSGLETVALNQAWWLGNNLLNVTSAGKYQFDYTGLQHESTYFLPASDDVLRLRFTELELDEVGRPGALNSLSSSQLAYRTYFKNINSYLELSYHNYITEDSGVSVEFKRFFGDVSVAMSIRDSERVRFAGLTLGLPISPRGGVKPMYGVQLMGTPEFATGVFTKVGEDDNSVALVGTALTSYPYNTSNLLLNRGRVGDSYFKQHYGRLREAFYMYGRSD